MTKSVKVITSFNENGEIRPIWLQYNEHDKNFTFMIL